MRLFSSPEAEIVLLCFPFSRLLVNFDDFKLQNLLRVSGELVAILRILHLRSSMTYEAYRECETTDHEILVTFSR